MNSSDIRYKMNAITGWLGEIRDLRLAAERSSRIFQLDFVVRGFQQRQMKVAQEHSRGFPVLCAPDRDGPDLAAFESAL